MKKLTEHSTYKEVTREFRWGMLWDLFDGNKKNLNIAHECLDRHVDKGTAIRLKFADHRTEKYTFKELSEWTSSFANFLESYGVQVGDRVCVMLEPSLEFYVCMFGAIKRGAIAVFTDKEWQALCNVLGDPGWSRETRFSTFLGRKENEIELNGLIEEWTMRHSPEEVMTEMQAAGIAAGVVQSNRDLHQDKQLRARQLFWETKHEELGTFPSLGQASRLSRTPSRPFRPAPLLGKHTEYVCTELLGMSDEEFVELLQSEAFG